MWKVSFRGCNPWWAASIEALGCAFSEVWDDIPWNDSLTERITTNEASAWEQYKTLRQWEVYMKQPVREVTLSHAPESEWTVIQ